MLAFVPYRLAIRQGRPRPGRIAARTAAGLLLAVYGLGPATFSVDLALDRGCVEMWGGAEGLVFFLSDDIAPILAASNAQNLWIGSGAYPPE